MAVPYMPETVVLLFAIFGLCHTSQFLLSFLGGIFDRLLRPAKNLKKSYGSWAVVTGATDGIGLAMAGELARKGQNVLLISRTKSKLEACRDDIKEKNPKIVVDILDIDYSNFDAVAQKRVADTIKDLEVGVLINNVGVSYPFPKFFNELTDDEVKGLISLNVESLTLMTRIVLPGMLERKKGAIVNIASAAGVSNSPLLSQYGAAKSYVAMFSRALDAELRPKGVHVQCQVPMFVATKLAKIRHASLFVPSPKGYARAAVAAIGHNALVSPYWAHAIQIWLMTHLPEWLVAHFARNMHLDLRRRGMKKEAEKNKHN